MALPAIIGWAVVGVATVGTAVISYFQGEEALEEQKRAGERFEPFKEQQLEMSKQAMMLIIAAIALVAMLWISRKKK